MDRSLLDEQIAYYGARAPEYDEWFLRIGRYDRGETHRRAWLAEIAEAEAALRDSDPHGGILELACGTGLWTRHLVRYASRLTAVDASPEMLEAAGARPGLAEVRFVQTDLFGWHPTEQYDFVFFSFWLSHVPSERFESWWSTVGSALRPGGWAFFVDSARHPESTATDHHLPGADQDIVLRRLNDGREFRAVKVFYEPVALERRLGALGWRGDVRATRQFFIHGCVQPR